MVEFGESVHFRPVGENNALRGGDQRLLRGVYVGHHERSGAGIARMLEHGRWDRVFSAAYVGVPWQLRPDERNLARLVVPEAEADQGVAPVIVMPAVPKVDRRRYVTKRDLVKFLGTQTSVKHARSWRQACTMRQFLVMTDAEIA